MDASNEVQPNWQSVLCCGMNACKYLYIYDYYIMWIYTNTNTRHFRGKQAYFRKFTNYANYFSFT